MAKSINGCSPQESVRKGVSPFAEIKIASDQSGHALMPFSNEVVQVLILGSPEWLEAQVVDDQQRHPDHGLEAALKGAHGTSCL